MRGDFINTASPETHGHPTSASCLGTAAYRYDSSPTVDVRDGHTVYPIIEQFSSNGPVVIYFDAAGNRLPTPQVRKQPVLAATNGVSTSFFPPASVTSGTTPPAPPGPSNPSPSDFNGDGYPNFFGTSAAAPTCGGRRRRRPRCRQGEQHHADPGGRGLAADLHHPGRTRTRRPTPRSAPPGTCRVVASGYARTDNNAYTVSYNGAAGTTLSTITIDLSTIGAHFDTTTAIPTDASTTATSTGVVVSVFNGTTTPAGFTAPSVASFTVGTGSTGTANSLLTVNFSNFNPGATLKFGVGRRNDTVNIYSQLSEVLGGQTAASPGALLSSTSSANATVASGTVRQHVQAEVELQGRLRPDQRAGGGQSSARSVSILRGVAAFARTAGTLGGGKSRTADAAT